MSKVSQLKVIPRRQMLDLGDVLGRLIVPASSQDLTGYMLTLCQPANGDY